VWVSFNRAAESNAIGCNGNGSRQIIAAQVPQLSLPTVVPLSRESAICMLVNNPSEPNLVWAKSPVIPGHVLLICHPATIDKVMELGSRAKLGEYWGLVHGNPGPMPDGFAQVQTEGLQGPTAIFRGLKRPLHYLHAVADSDVYIYVTNPEWTYTYRPSRHGDAVMPEPKPIESVFTTFVSFNPTHIDEAASSVRKALSAKPSGVVLFWEWTESARENTLLPLDSQGRYETRIL